MKKLTRVARPPHRSRVRAWHRPRPSAEVEAELVVIVDAIRDRSAFPT